MRIVIEDSQGDLPIIDLTHHQTIEQLRLACCRTYANLQGLTLNDHLLLLDTRHRFMCRRKLYVAMSRVTQGRFLHVPTLEQERSLFDTERGNLERTSLVFL